MGLFLGFTQFQSGIQPVAFAEAFPTNVRYSGSALAYTGANLLTGGPMPLIAVYLVSGSEHCVAFTEHLEAATGLVLAAASDD